MKSRNLKLKAITVGVVTVAVLSAIGVFIYLKFVNKPKSYPQVPISSTTDSQGKDVAVADPNVPGGATGNDVTSDAKLTAPSGIFVSSHTLPIAAQAESTCTTTVSASCQIVFTKDSLEKSLPAKTAELNRSDQNGTVTWPLWTPKSIGLTPGTWTVTAKATLGSQHLSTVDQVKLVVQP